VIVQEAKFKINRSSCYMILKEPYIPQGLELAKNHLYTTQFVIRPIEEVDDFNLGEVELKITRKEDLNREDKSIVF